MSRTEIVRFTMLHIIVCCHKLQASKYNDFGDSNKARSSLMCSGVLVFVGAVAGLTVIVLFIVLENSSSNDANSEDNY